MNHLLKLKCKKWIILFFVLIFTATATLIGCSAKQKNSEFPTPSVTPTPTLTPTPTPTDTSTLSASPESSKVIDTIDDEKLNAMLPIFDTIVYWNALDPEVEQTGIKRYEPENHEYAWSLIYLAIVNFAEPGVNGVDFTEDLHYKQAPAALVREYASALFANFGNLPALPPEKGIQYDSSLDTYLFEMSDHSEGVTSIEKYTKDSDGYYIVDLTFGLPYESDFEPLYYSLRIVKNTYSPNGEEPLFAYAVKELLS